MKTITRIATTLAMTAATFAVHAAEQGDGALAVCEAEIQRHYGDSSEIMLVSQRQYGHGTRMKVAARLDRDNSRFATCWVTPDDIAALQREQESELLVAASESPAGLTP
jgi:hypothetical protein